MCMSQNLHLSPCEGCPSCSHFSCINISSMCTVYRCGVHGAHAKVCKIAASVVLIAAVVSLWLVVWRLLLPLSDLRSAQRMALRRAPLLRSSQEAWAVACHLDFLCKWEWPMLAPLQNSCHFFSWRFSTYVGNEIIPYGLWRTHHECLNPSHYSC